MQIEKLVLEAPERPGFTNNVWIVGDPAGSGGDCVVVDAAHDADAIAAAVGDRTVTAILTTHGHWDHVGAAPRLSELTGAPALLHPADRFLWDVTNPDTAPGGDLSDGLTLPVADGSAEVRHTPGHTPGSCVVLVRDRAGEVQGVLSGDTLFENGVGATRWEYSDAAGLLESIAAKILTLPDATPVHTGHGPSTSVGAEAPPIRAHLARGV